MSKNYSFGEKVFFYKKCNSYYHKRSDERTPENLMKGTNVALNDVMVQSKDITIIGLHRYTVREDGRREDLLTFII